MKSAGLVLAMMCSSLTAQVMGSARPLSGATHTGQASIEGTVLDAGTREPIKKASVMLVGPLAVNAVTDASGHFAFRQLPAGQYVIQAQSDKYPFMLPVVEDGHFLSVTVADEQKLEVGLTLSPGASIQGRVVDDEGNPMPRCNVTPMQFRDTDGGRALQNSTFAQSDELGEYRISKVSAGKYYVMARCYQTVQLPHALIRRGAATDVPMLAYAPQFYPGVPDLTGATRVEAQANTNISGIDFRMLPAGGVTVRGHAGPMPSDENLQIALQPKDPVRRAWQSPNVRIGSSGEFRIPNVMPGSYALTAMGTSDGHLYFARVQVEIGVTPLDPIEVVLAPAPSLSGTVSIEGDGKVALNNLHVRMDSLDRMQQVMGGTPEADVQSDSTFTLKSIVPGHWRLFVNGAPGYVKSVMRGDQEVSPEDIEIGPAGAGLLKIVIGTKLGQIDASISSPPAGASQLFAVSWPASLGPSYRPVDPQGRVTFSVPPGKYHVCAVANGQPWMLMQNRALLKALESVCEGVEVGEGGRASVQMQVVTVQELKRIMEKLEE
jgi:Carboxypeptidase regulatory-like domain